MNRTDRRRYKALKDKPNSGPKLRYKASAKRHGRLVVHGKQLKKDGP